MEKFFDKSEVVSILEDIRELFGLCLQSSMISTVEEKRIDLLSQIQSTDFYKDKRLTKNVYNELKLVNSIIQQKEEIDKGIIDSEELLSEVSSNDYDMIEDIRQSLFDIKGKVEDLRTRALMVGEYDNCNIILEINAGAGGLDAQDWVGILYRMYHSYCTKRGYTVELLDESVDSGGGIKSISCSVAGINVYGYLKAERGVHRLVRISPFDSNARRHTSFASVEIMPDIESDNVVEIKNEDIRVDTFRSSGAGGQHVNKTDSAIRITHLPSNIVVVCQNQRSQIQNRESAMKILRAKLLDKYEKENLDKMQSIKGELKKIEWGSQIRSYVFAPYTLVKDHRTGYEESDVQSVIDGDIHQFVLEYLIKL